MKPGTRLTCGIAALCTLLLFKSFSEPKASFKHSAICSLSDDLSLSEDELATIANLIGSSTVVALGEATHGTFEETFLRAQIAKYLITKKGFSIIAIEDQVAGAEAIDLRLNDEEFDANSILLNLDFWPWQNVEMGRLLEWIHKQRAADPNFKSRFMGFDTQNPFSAAFALNAMAKEKFGLRFETKREENRRTLRIVGGHEDDAKDAEDILVYANSQETEPILKLYALATYHYFLQLDKPYDREKGMAAVIRKIRELFPERKMILWGHNVHFAQSSNLPGSRFPALGNYLVEAFGDDYFVLGLIVGGGSYRAYNFDTGRLDSNTMPDAPDSSVENLLKSTFDGPTLLVVNESLNERLMQRLPGSFATEKQFYQRNIKEDYDALIWIPEAGASDLIDFSKRRKQNSNQSVDTTSANDPR